MLSWFLTLCGCGDNNSTRLDFDPNASIVREIAVVGFDVDAEPVIREMSDGSIWIHFEAMPPFFADDDPSSFDVQDFHDQLQSAAAAPVTHDDREVFAIAKPTPETANALKLWLETYRKTNGG
ncbi:hypothetical protein Poly59_36410 [Rubripirellula reticaptiva]|uniref:Uncharacterized protein n=2 Tax=Rubripirellula reticaptiva TaxID=2528013 RepID=A0A5C6EUH0_9BACT|nr:hypothetical protein Poly59_36410 [Rubripirellula reticaptiva]